MSMINSLDTEFEPLITGRAKLAVEAKTEWESVGKELAEKDLGRKLEEKHGKLDRCDDARREAELHPGQSAAELDTDKAVNEFQRQSLLAQIKALHKTISKLEQQNLEIGSIKDPRNRAMLRALFNQLDEQNRNADVVYEQFVLAFQSVMGWLRTLASELKKRAKPFSASKVRGILQSHYCKNGAKITNEDELFTVMEEMIKTAMKPTKGRKGKKAPPNVAQFDDDELQECTRRIAHIFPFPEQYVCGTGEQVDGEGEKDSAAPAMSPLDRHIQAMISKLERQYLSSEKSSIGRKLAKLKLKLDEQLVDMRLNLRLKPVKGMHDDEWEEKLDEKKRDIEAARGNIREAEDERAEALQDLSSTKLLLERLIISWTDTVEQAHQEQGVTEFEARLDKFASTFENSVRPWMQFLQLIQTASKSKPKSCLRFEMPKLTFCGENDQLALTHKNLHRIFNILDVPPKEREQRARSAGTSSVPSIPGDESD